jgi:hypothetical protein
MQEDRTAFVRYSTVRYRTTHYSAVQYSVAVFLTVTLHSLEHCSVLLIFSVQAVLVLSVPALRHWQERRRGERGEREEKRGEEERVERRRRRRGEVRWGEG